jgi:hypothetical protein
MYCTLNKTKQEEKYNRPPKLVYSMPLPKHNQSRNEKDFGYFVAIARNVGQDGGHDKKLRNKMASDNARISIGI